MTHTHASDGVEPARLAEEQAALRRVATLVAQGAEPSRLFAVVAEQVAHVLGVPFASVVRFEDEGTVVQRASYAERGVVFPSDKRWPLEGTSALAQVHAHGKPARLEDYSGSEGEIAEYVRRVGIRSTVAVPIVVAGRLWGAMVVSATESALPADTEARLTDFTELLATAIANSESQDEVTRLAKEQAALRRVATLVAHDVPSDELFRAVGGEVGRLLGTDLAGISRYDPDDVVTHFASWSAAGEAPDTAGRVSRDSPGLSKTIRDTGRPARVDEWHEIPAVVTGADHALKVRSAVGSPIVVENRVWGKLVVASTQSQLAPDTESRLMAFTELVGTAIANADARGHVRRLAEEQAALRRVATLVAEDVPARELFGAVVGEVGVLLGADLGGMIRYENDGTVTAVAAWAAVGEHPPVPERWQIEPGDPAWMILESRAATRVEDWASVPGPFAEAVRNNFGVSSSVGCPIVVEGRLWGALAIHSKQSRSLAPDTESRIAKFTDLVGTAIANAESRERADRLGDEQAALRRVATLVAKEASPAEVFATVAEEAANVLGEVECALLRDEGDGTARTVAAWGAGMAARFAVGAPVPADGDGVLAFVLREGRPRRIDDYSAVGEPTAEGAREHGIGSAVGYPIVVGGGIWGAIVAARFGAQPCPPETESHIARFADLVATAVANAGSRAEVGRLADEQAALRRVATLVAQDAPADELFDAVAHEAAVLLACDRAAIVRFAGDGTATVVGGHSARRTAGIPFTPDPDYVIAAVHATGRAARFDTDDPSAAAMPEPVRAEGICSGLASPIVVDGALWGTITVASLGRSLPSHTEHRLAEFTELVATAISNAQSREARQVLADEQAALRRVATLVAKEGPPAEVLVKIAEQVASLLGDADCALYRDEGDGTATVVGVAGTTLSAAVQVGSRWPTDGTGVIATVLREGRPHRIDDFADATGTIATVGRDRIGVRTAVGCPIVVGGRIWGAIAAGRYRSEAFPAETDAALTRFAELAATAVANAEARAEVERLAEEQAALRRVATLVAEGVEPAELFSAVTQEIAGLFSAVTPPFAVTVIRFDPEPEFVLVGASTATDPPIGARWGSTDFYVSTRVHRTGGSARVDAADLEVDSPEADTLRRQGFLYQVGSPIVVEGRLWGAMTTNSAEPLPPDADQRLEKFTELVATAIANSESRAEVERLAAEQAALRRVATLVAQGGSPSVVLDAVAAEMERALGADASMLLRYEPDEEVTVAASRVPNERELLPGTRVSHAGENVSSMVRRTGRPTRIGDYRQARGPIADLARAAEWVGAAVGAPIVVDGRLWGVIIASWGDERSPADDSEERMVKFAQLLETAIANADGRDQLMASRARVLSAGDEARRRVVRDLHDGAQQRLVHTVITLKLAQRAFRDDDGKAESLLSEALEHAQQGNRELRELAHGILPAALTQGGIRAGVDAVVTRLDLPVGVDVPADRLPAEIEASAYFIVAEALTNVVKHSHAGRAEVKASLEDATLRIEVRDNGTGGADPDGHGLVGMRDRVTTLGGRLEIESPAGGGTLVAATLPLPAG